ncbi:SDR family oxidoreductase [Rhodococcus zopfii]|uniref:SDR family oxidoreductase n=1 Tax=Rhodococcus zopfii TaxID=43772 RepID=UPI0011112389|nr:SDR family oxidoreductase [Rhodococcus zopfii]
MGGLTGSTVLVSGAARGIGAATARALAAEGARLVLFDVDAQPLQELVVEIGEDRAVGTVADVRDLAAVQAAVDAGIDRFGGLDFAVANAGVGSYGSVLQVDPEAFRAVIEIDLVGVFHTVRASLPALVERHGYLLLVSSMAAYLPVPGQAPYNAAKAGVEQFANTVRLEVARHGVAVGSAHMAWIDTPLIRDARADLPAFDRMLATLPGPLGRVHAVDECAAAFVRALENRSRRVYVPGSMRILAWAQPLITSTTAERFMLRMMSRAPNVDDRVAALGRSMSARILAALPARQPSP